MTPETAAFAAQRDAELTAADTDLHPLVVDALDRLYAGDDEDWYVDLVEGAEVLWTETFGQVPAAGEPDPADLNTFGSELAGQLAETSTKYGATTEAQADAVTRWVSTYTVNNATSVASGATGGDVAWVTMHDEDVRASHAALDGEIRPVGGTFDVGGVSLHYPGEPVGPPDAWINCRCVLLPLEAQMTAATTAPQALTFNGDPTNPTTTTTTYADTAVASESAAEPTVTDPTTGYEDLEHAVPWHGIVAPLDQRSGDRREIASGALTYRNLPLPLRWQKVDAPGHDGSVVVGNITWIGEEDGLLKAEGTFATTAEADEVVGLVAEQMLRGVSVDLDGETEFELVTDTGDPFDLEGYTPGDPEPVRRVTAGRVTSAAIVAIPAFQEAFVRLGTWADGASDEQVLTASGCAPCEAATQMDAYFEELSGFAISESSWDGSAGRFEDDEWRRSTIVDRGASYSTPKERYAVPIKEPNGDLSRAGVHAAASRLNQVDAPDSAIAAAGRKLVAAYRTLGEDPPESLQAAAAGWTDVYAAPPFPPSDTKSDETDDAEDAGDTPEAGDTVTWSDDAGEHTGVVESVDGDTAQVVEGDAPPVAVPVSQLTVVDDDGDGDDGAGGRPFAVTSNPGTHDGPGWITHPTDTQRLRTYWTRGEGAAKIRWGQPGDFNRCRTQLAKYITNPHYLAGTCSNMHKVALGVWPGQESSAAAADLTASAAPAFTILAAASPATPPAAWFTDPGLDGPTPLTVDGQRVYGHLAAWGTCHIGLGLGVGDGKECITPPHSDSGYAFFHTGAVRTDDGQLVPVGHVTLGTGHAPASMSSRPAAAHYDNTGSVVADVAVGEDEHGIWFSGAVRDGVDVSQLEAAALSGDWRTPYPGAGYELVAALGVNVPGFPIPRISIGASGGRQTSLVAAGVVLPTGREVAFDTTTLAKDVYNQMQTIGRRADRRRKLATQMRVLRRDQLTARVGG
jgi:hypothetical protein